MAHTKLERGAIAFTGVAQTAWVNNTLKLGQPIEHGGGGYFNAPHAGVAARSGRLPFSWLRRPVAALPYKKLMCTGIAQFNLKWPQTIE